MNHLTVAICGLDCEKCEAYIATKNDDQALREKTAKLWSELNNAPILPEHINKGYETCGVCPEKDTCSIVSAIWQRNPKAKENLKG